jgi:hypothetical protein
MATMVAGAGTPVCGERDTARVSNVADSPRKPPAAVAVAGAG